MNGDAPSALERLAAEEAAIWKQNPYYEHAEPYMESLWQGLIWPIVADFDFTVTIDLACGHGRNTAFLVPLAQRLYAMDVNEENVAFCRARFAGTPQVVPVRNNGLSFDPVADGEATAIYCFDAMVHFDSDVVRAYLVDAARVLRPNGRAFFHHSNYGGAPAGHFHQNPHIRNFMTKELFAHYAAKSGLRVVSQRAIDWADAPELDCLSVVMRPDDEPAAAQ
jgi:SAM-dependent methyltransferase